MKNTYCKTRQEKGGRGDLTRWRRLSLPAFGLLVLALVAAPSFVSAATYTVSKTADTNDGTCDADCSLREAVAAANAGAGADTITFDIPNTDPGYIDNPPAGPGGDDYWRISVASALTINAANGAGTVVDGSTQTTNRGNTNTLGPEIEVRGSGAANIFVINNVGTITIRDLVINNATGAGVWITAGSATFNKLYGNYIGTNATGTTAVANGAQGVLLDGGASNNDVGGPNAGEGNVISGNSTHGIQIGTNANNNKIRGNKIGTNAAGNAVVSNGRLGVQINGVPTSGTQIGGALPGEGNIISGNGPSGGPWDGISIGTDATNVTIQGNKIGTDTSGTLNLGNYRRGVSMDCTLATCNNKLGGVYAGEENLIAYNAQGGARILSSAGNGAGSEIVGNEIRDNGGIGVNLSTVSGPLVAKNLIRNNGATSDGLAVGASVTNAKLYQNTIHANGGDGIQIGSSGTIVKNNIITGNGTGGTGYGINLVTGPMTEDYNDVFNNTTGACLGCTLGANSITSDPLYNADFSLQAGSLAMNAGCDLGAAGDDTACDSAADGPQPDMTGNAGDGLNYFGSAPDMGAYESGSAGITISGTVYSDEGVTNIGSGKTVRLLVNGASAGTAVTNASGQYSISASVSTGDALAVFVSGAAANKGSTVTVSNGASLSNLNIYTGDDFVSYNYVITRHDNGGTLTNALMAAAKGAYAGADAADLLYSVSGGNLTVSGNTTRLYVASGYAYAPGGNVTTPHLKSLGTFNGGAGTIDSNADLLIAGGAFTATSGTTNIGGNYTLSAGTFTHNNGTVTFDGTSGTKQITPGGQSFYNITFNDGGGTATYELQGALTVANDLTVTDGILDTKAGSNYAVNVTRDFIQTGGQVEAQSSTVTVGRHFTASGAEVEDGFNSATLVLTGTGGLTYSGLVSDWQNGFNNLTVAQSGNTTTLNNTIAVLGTLAVGSGTFTGPGAQSVYLRKPVPGSPFDFDDVTAATRISVPYLKMYGTWDQELPPLPNGRGYDSNITIAIDSNGGATVTQTGDVTIVAPKSFRMVGDGSASRVQNYNTGEFALNVGGDFLLGWGSDTGTKTFDATNSTITVGGNIDIRTGTNVFTNTNSTVILNGAALQTVLMNGKNFNNLTITNASAAGVQFLDGFSAANVTDTTAASKLTFNAGSTYTLSGTVTLTGASGQLINLRSSTPGTRWNFTLTASATKAISFVDVQDSDASGSNAAKIPINPASSFNSGNNIQWFNTCPVVSTTSDAGDGSLRECITWANGNAGQDTITFNSTVFNPGTINVASSLPPLTDASGAIINGGNASNVIIDGSAPAAVGLTLDSDGNQIKNITIRNFNGTGTDGAGVSIPSGRKNNLLDTVTLTGNQTQGVYAANDNDGTQIMNSTITNNDDAGVWFADAVQGCADLTRTDNISMTGNTISGATAGAGIRADGISNGLFRSNTLSSNGTYGIFIRNCSTGNEIGLNTVDDNGTAAVANRGGIAFVLESTGNTVWGNTVALNNGLGIGFSASNDNKIYHNTVHGNKVGGSYNGDGMTILAGVTGTILRNNIITGNAGLGINLASGNPADMAESYNDVTDNVVNPASIRNSAGRSNVALNAADLNADPLYVDAAGGDVTLTACTSPAINAGTDLGPDQPDLTNGVDPDGYFETAPDMGANETTCATLSLVKQAWTTGGTLLATSNGAPSSVTVPSGDTVVFLIYIKNTGSTAATDIRFSDLLDVSASGFDYVAGSLVRTDPAAPPSDTATDLAIFNATAPPVTCPGPEPGTGVCLTDAVDGDVGSVCDSGAGACPGTTLNRVTVGNTTGLTPAQANGTLSIPANKSFAIRFRAVKK